VRERLRELLGGGGEVRAELQGLYENLANSQRPNTIASWLNKSKASVVLAEFGAGRRALTHAGLDELPMSKPVEHLRAILVATNTLPARDEHLVRVEHWVTATITGHPQAQVLHRYAIWHLLRVREINRLEKVLEDAGIRLSSVATDILGVSGRAVLNAMVGGEKDPAVLANLARMSLRNKTDQLTAALTGRFTDHHAFLVRIHLQVIDQLAASIAEFTERIETVIEPFRPVLTLLKTVPGISDRVAVTIVAETGADMSRFPTVAHLASWAGVCPGNHESVGRVGSTSTRPGNAHLKAALGNAVMGAARTNGYLQSRHRRRATRSTALKALVATEHAIIISIWHMLTTGRPYQDLGADYYLRRDPEATKRRIIRQANDMGLTVRFDPIEQLG